MKFNSRLKAQSFSLLLVGLYGYSGISNAADVGCSGNAAVYDVVNNSVCFPAVEVSDYTGKHTYKAQLNGQTVSNAQHFVLSSSEQIAATAVNSATFTPNNGALQIPVVEIRNAYGIERYNATLTLDSGSSPISFSLANVGAIISPDYAPGKTWKPYVGLLANEKKAVNVLERSLPYAQIANAVYDFGNTPVGDWSLVESVSKGSGMQAAIYINKITQDLALAYRGTEFCDPLSFSCSLSQIAESGKDTLTDTLLTQGRDSGQFDDAYNYARDMIIKYPGRIKAVIGHSLGGGLAQAVGAASSIETFAFNSSPVANNYFDQHGVKAKDPNYANFIYVLSDVHDPVSNTDEKGNVYADAAHVAPLLQFDFDKKEVLPTYKVTFDSLRFNKHSIVTLINNITSLTSIYQGGW